MQSLATLYRPKVFEDITEQYSTVKILQQQALSGHIANSMLFCGPTGCGKTSLARAFANTINNNQGTPIEIDAASNSGVDNVRRIIQDAQERAIAGTYKVIILDEAHAFSNTAWQAWLKCIEEPPQYTIFIFCTTDPQKIPATILNRVMRFNFTRISSTGIQNRLEYICRQEGFENYEEACAYISKISNGEMRTAISLLDKAAHYSTNLKIENILEALGNFSYEIFFELCNAFIDSNDKKILSIIDSYHRNGNDMKLFINQYIDFILDVLKYCIFKSTDIIKIPSTQHNTLNYTTNVENADKYFKFILDKLLNLKFMLKDDVDPKSTIEVVFLQIARGV